MLLDDFCLSVCAVRSTATRRSQSSVPNITIAVSEEDAKAVPEKKTSAKLPVELKVSTSCRGLCQAQFWSRNRSFLCNSQFPRFMADTYPSAYIIKWLSLLSIAVIKLVQV